MTPREQTVLVLVRHGETSANLDGVWHGSIDTPLTERGRRQAERVAEYLAAEGDALAALYSSPLQRARHTAEAIARSLALEVSLEPELREYHLGLWEGRTYRELHEVQNLWHHMRRDPDYAPHGGESPKQVAGRFTGALRAIAERHRGQRVAVVAHGGALSMGLGLLLEGDYARWSRVMDNCAVTELAFAGEVSLLRFNLVDHLAGV